MTSTNDGKDVKSNKTSSPKGKSHYIELFKFLESRLSGECSGKERTQFLCDAWHQVHSLCVHSTAKTHVYLLSWIQRHTATSILQDKWREPESKDQHDLLNAAIDDLIKECQDAATSRNGAGPLWESELLQRAEWFKSVLSNPWGHPVLKALLNPSGEQPTEEQVVEWVRQERGLVFVARVRHLAAAGRCRDLALLLAAAVMDRARPHLHTPDPVIGTDKPPETDNLERNFADVLKTEAGFTFDVWDLLADIEFMLLHKGESRTQCIELAKQIPLLVGSRMVERLRNRLEKSPREKKLWKNAKDAAIVIAQVVIARCMVIPVCSGHVRVALHRCAKELVRLLSPPRLRSAAAALAAPAATARHLHTLAEAAHVECDNAQKPFVCELYVRAITVGMNELENLKLKSDKQAEARASEEILSTWFTQLGKLLQSSARLSYECVLTAFSVHPSPLMFERVKSAPAFDPIVKDVPEPESETNPEFGSWATDSRTQTNFVKTSKTLNLERTQKQANVLSTAIFPEGEALGLGAELCQDLAVLLSVRVKTLSWDMDRELLMENCKTHMERTCSGTRSLTRELKYLNLDPKAFQHLREEEDDENDIYYGIEKGYEHLVEFQETEESWKDSEFDDPERTESCSSSNMEVPIAIPRRKKKSKRQKDVDEEIDPLSLDSNIANIKKERPISNERSKDRSKEKRKHKNGNKEPGKDESNVKNIGIKIQLDDNEFGHLNESIIKLEKEQRKRERKKERREHKKREKLKMLQEIQPEYPSSRLGTSVSRVPSVKESIERRRKESELQNLLSSTVSSYDSLGKLSHESTNSRGNIIYDGLFSIDDTKFAGKSQASSYVSKPSISKIDKIYTSSGNLENLADVASSLHNIPFTTSFTPARPDKTANELYSQDAHNTSPRSKIDYRDAQKSLKNLLEFRRKKNNINLRNVGSQHSAAVIYSPIMAIDIQPPHGLSILREEVKVASNKFLSPTSTKDQNLSNEKRDGFNTNVLTGPKSVIDSSVFKTDLSKQQSKTLINNVTQNKFMKPPILRNDNNILNQKRSNDRNVSTKIINRDLSVPNINKIPINLKETSETPPSNHSEDYSNDTSAHVSNVFEIGQKEYHDFLKQKYSLNLPTPSQSGVVNKNQDLKTKQSLLKKSHNDLLRQSPDHHKPPKRSQVTVSPSTSSKVKNSIRGIDSNASVSASQRQFQEFLKELGQTIDAGSLDKVKRTQSVAKLSCVQQSKQQRKPENAPTTFSRLSYMHRSKQQGNSKLKQTHDPTLQNVQFLQDIKDTNDEIESFEKINNLQSKGEIVISRINKNVNKDSINKVCQVNANCMDRLKFPFPANMKHRREGVNINNCDIKVTESSVNHVTDTYNLPVQSFLTNKDKHDLQLLSMQKSKLNANRNQSKNDIIKADSAHEKYVPDTKVIQHEISEFKLLQPNKANLPTRNTNTTATVPDGTLSKSVYPITDIPTNKYKEHDMLTLERGPHLKKDSDKTSTEIIDTDKPKPEWETVIDELLAHKTPSRGPSALDIALKRASFKKGQSSISSGNLICSKTSKKYSQEQPIKLKSTVDGNKNKVTLSSTANNVIPATLLSILNSEKRLQSNESAIIKDTIVNSNKTKVTLPSPANNEYPVTLLSLLNSDKHSQSTPDQRSVLEEKNITGVILSNNIDPFISGIPNSDYDLLEELMDDDLRKEIGELSSDEEHYDLNNSPVSKIKSNNLKRNSIQTKTVTSNVIGFSAVNQTLVPNKASWSTKRPDQCAAKRNISVSNDNITSNTKPCIISNELIAVAPQQKLASKILNPAPQKSYDSKMLNSDKQSKNTDINLKNPVTIVNPANVFLTSQPEHKIAKNVMLLNSHLAYEPCPTVKIQKSQKNISYQNIYNTVTPSPNLTLFQSTQFATSVNNSVIIRKPITSCKPSSALVDVITKLDSTIYDSDNYVVKSIPKETKSIASKQFKYPRRNTIVSKDEEKCSNKNNDSSDTDTKCIDSNKNNDSSDTKCIDSSKMNANIIGSAIKSPASCESSFVLVDVTSKLDSIINDSDNSVLKSLPEETKSISSKHCKDMRRNVSVSKDVEKCSNKNNDSSDADAKCIDSNKNNDLSDTKCIDSSKMNANIIGSAIKSPASCESSFVLVDVKSKLDSAINYSDNSVFKSIPEETKSIDLKHCNDLQRKNVSVFEDKEKCSNKNNDSSDTDAKCIDSNKNNDLSDTKCIDSSKMNANIIGSAIKSPASCESSFVLVDVKSKLDSAINYSDNSVFKSIPEETKSIDLKHCNDLQRKNVSVFEDKEKFSNKNYDPSDTDTKSVDSNESSADKPLYIKSNQTQRFQSFGKDYFVKDIDISEKKDPDDLITMENSDHLNKNCERKVLSQVQDKLPNLLSDKNSTGTIKKKHVLDNDNNKKVLTDQERIKNKRMLLLNRKIIQCSFGEPIALTYIPIKQSQSVSSGKEVQDIVGDNSKNSVKENNCRNIVISQIPVLMGVPEVINDISFENGQEESNCRSLKNESCKENNEKNEPLGRRILLRSSNSVDDAVTKSDVNKNLNYKDVTDCKVRPKSISKQMNLKDGKTRSSPTRTSKRLSNKINRPYEICQKTIQLDDVSPTKLIEISDLVMNKDVEEKSSMEIFKEDVFSAVVSDESDLLLNHSNNQEAVVKNDQMEAENLAEKSITDSKSSLISVPVSPTLIIVNESGNENYLPLNQSIVNRPHITKRLINEKIESSEEVEQLDEVADTARIEKASENVITAKSKGDSQKSQNKRTNNVEDLNEYGKTVSMMSLSNSSSVISTDNVRSISEVDDKSKTLNRKSPRQPKTNSKINYKHSLSNQTECINENRELTEVKTLITDTPVIEKVTTNNTRKVNNIRIDSNTAIEMNNRNDPMKLTVNSHRTAGRNEDNQKDVLYSKNDLNYLKDKVVLEELPSQDPLKKKIRLKLPNNNVFIATICGKLRVDIDTLFNEPSMKKFLTNTLSDLKACTVNIEQVKSQRNSITPCVKKITYSQSIRKVSETIDLISDDDEEVDNSYSFNTQFGVYKINSTIDGSTVALHQRKFKQKCTVKVERCKVLHKLLQSLSPDIARVENINATLSSADNTNDKLCDDIISNIIEINDSSSESECNDDTSDCIVFDECNTQNNIKDKDIDINAEKSIATISPLKNNSKLYTENEILSDSKLMQQCFVNLVKCDDIIDQYQTKKYEKHEGSSMSEVMECFWSDEEIPRQNSPSLLDEFKIQSSEIISLPSDENSYQFLSYCDRCDSEWLTTKAKLNLLHKKPAIAKSLFIIESRDTSVSNINFNNIVSYKGLSVPSLTNLVTNFIVNENYNMLENIKHTENNIKCNSEEVSISHRLKRKLIAADENKSYKICKMNTGRNKEIADIVKSDINYIKNGLSEHSYYINDIMSKESTNKLPSDPENVYEINIDKSDTNFIRSTVIHEAHNKDNCNNVYVDENQGPSKNSDHFNNLATSNLKSVESETEISQLNHKTGSDNELLSNKRTKDFPNVNTSEKITFLEESIIKDKFNNFSNEISDNIKRHDHLAAKVFQISQNCDTVIDTDQRDHFTKDFLRSNRNKIIKSDNTEVSIISSEDFLTKSGHINKSSDGRSEFIDKCVINNLEYVRNIVLPIINEVQNHVHTKSLETHAFLSKNITECQPIEINTQDDFAPEILVSETCMKENKMKNDFTKDTQLNCTMSQANTTVFSRGKASSPALDCNRVEEMFVFKTCAENTIVESDIHSMTRFHCTNNHENEIPLANKSIPIVSTVVQSDAAVNQLDTDCNGVKEMIVSEICKTETKTMENVISEDSIEFNCTKINKSEMPLANKSLSQASNAVQSLIKVGSSDLGCNSIKEMLVSETCWTENKTMENDIPKDTIKINCTENYENEILLANKFVSEPSTAVQGLVKAGSSDLDSHSIRMFVSETCRTENKTVENDNPKDSVEINCTKNNENKILLANNSISKASNVVQSHVEASKSHTDCNSIKGMIVSETCMTKNNIPEDSIEINCNNEIKILLVNKSMPKASSVVQIPVKANKLDIYCDSNKEMFVSEICRTKISTGENKDSLELNYFQNNDNEMPLANKSMPKASSVVQCHVEAIKPDMNCNRIKETFLSETCTTENKIMENDIPKDGIELNCTKNHEHKIPLSIIPMASIGGQSRAEPNKSDIDCNSIKETDIPENNNKLKCVTIHEHEIPSANKIVSGANTAEQSYIKASNSDVDYCKSIEEVIVLNRTRENNQNDLAINLLPMENQNIEYVSKDNEIICTVDHVIQDHINTFKLESLTDIHCNDIVDIIVINDKIGNDLTRVICRNEHNNKDVITKEIIEAVDIVNLNSENRDTHTQIFESNKECKTIVLDACDLELEHKNKIEKNRYVITPIEAHSIIECEANIVAEDNSIEMEKVTSRNLLKNMIVKEDIQDNLQNVYGSTINDIEKKVAISEKKMSTACQSSYTFYHESDLKNLNKVKPVNFIYSNLKDLKQISFSKSEQNMSVGSVLVNNIRNDSGETVDNTVNTISLVYKNSDVVLKGSIYNDQVFGTCYVFPLINNKVDDTFSMMQKLKQEVRYTLAEDSDENTNLVLTLPKNTYLRQCLSSKENCYKRNLKRKIYLQEYRLERKYRKGKNIDYPKMTFANICESSYNKEYKRVFDYFSSIKFSYSRPFHKDYIDVSDMLKCWPIEGGFSAPSSYRSENVDTTIFMESNSAFKAPFDPLQQTLAEEMLTQDEELLPFDQGGDTSFSMGFGEGSGRVIQNSRDGNDNISKISAVTLSDVKQSQPCLLFEEYKKNENEICQKYSKSIEDQVQIMKRYFSYIQLRDKVRSFFRKTTIELNQEWLSKTKNDTILNRFPYELTSPNFIRPAPNETIVQVVQVGQLPVSAAAQNPVTCDPRVTQVSNASPSQCLESSPNDEPQSAVKTEYTELTTADLSLPLGHGYNQNEQVIPMEPQENSNAVIDSDNIRISNDTDSVCKSETTTKLQENRDEKSNCNEKNELQYLINKHINNGTYSYNSNNNGTSLVSESRNTIMFENHNSPESSIQQQKQQNGTSEKTDQIAHAMNAAGITTADNEINTGAHTLVNIVSQTTRQNAVNVTQSSVNNFGKSTSINAMALQQALAQILPPPLNQTNTSESSQQSQNTAITSQVLHIVQGKNTPGNQITIVDNPQNSVISTPNTTSVLHIVQNKATSGGSTSNTNTVQHTNSFSGLSLVDAGLQQGGNQLLHIVNTGNQKHSNSGQLLKRVNLLTNLTNVQGSNEQKMVQFVCKSADGKSIQLNAPHQRSMVLRLQPIESTNLSNVSKTTDGQDFTPPQNSITPCKDANNSQQEIKSRSIYEENYAKFIQNSSHKSSSVEKSTSLPKFNQAFGKQVFQDNNQKSHEVNSNNSHLSSTNSNTDTLECQSTEGAMNLDHISQINSPPLLLRKSPAQTSQTQPAQPSLVQQLKQTIAPMNIQTVHGGVIYTRQIPVNIGGGQTINLITVPSTDIIDETGQKQQSEVKFVSQGEMEPSIIKIIPQNQSSSNTDGNTEESNNNLATESSQQNNTQTPAHPVLTQMRIKLPMLSKTPQMVSGARVVRPSFFQIQRNVIGGANQPVYQQLVLTAAPPLGQQTIRLPQTQTTRHVKTPTDNQSSPESQMSSSTLEQLREFDMVLEQVKERSTVQPNSNSSFVTKLHTSTTDSAENASHTPINVSSTDTTQQVLYSIGNNNSLNVAYINRKPNVTTPTGTSFVRSPDSSGIVDSPTTSAHVQMSHGTTNDSCTNEGTSHQTQPKAAKIHSKSKSRPKASSNPPNTLKLNTVPPKTSTQKPLEDEQTTQRILYILAEYKEQVENSPDKDKPAPRRRSNPPSNPGSSKRKKSSSGSRRSGGRDMSPVLGEDTCRTMGSEDSSCGTSQGDCTDSCFDSHSPQDSPRKVVRKLTFENETANSATTTPPRQLPQRNVIVADGQTITVARGTAGKPATAVLMPANYILPVSMVKGGQQIAIVTNRGPKILTVGGGEGGTTNALLLQRLIGPAGLKPVLARPGVRHVRLPTTALHNLQAFNLAAATTVQSDSAASPAPGPTPPDLVETRAASSPWADRDSQDIKPERGSSPEGSEPWHLPSSVETNDYTYEEPVRTENMNRTVLDAIPDRYSPDMEAQRIFDKMFDVDTKKSYIVDTQDDSPRCAYDIDASDCDDKAYQQVVQKKDSSHRLHRVANVSAAALRHKYAILEHELRLQKSLSEECEDLGVDSPSASELFPEAELLFAHSPAHDTQHHSHTPQPVLSSSIPQPDIDDQIATDQLLPRLQEELAEATVTVSEALRHEEFARAHPNTTFHSEPTDEGELQPFTIAGLKGRHITSTIFHSARAPATVLMTAPQTTVISQAMPDSGIHNHLKFANIDSLMNSTPGQQNILSSVLVKDDGLTKYDSILNDSRELHLSHTASAIVHSTGNATQVIRRVCYEDDKRDTRFLIDDNDAILAGEDAKMIAEDSSRDATLESMAGDVDDDGSSPERHAELFWESNSASERSESRRPLDFSSDSDKCCKSPSYDETNSTDSSGVGTHMRLDSVIKEARGIERSGSADGSSADDTHLPLRTYPPKRMYSMETEMGRSMTGKTRAGERSPNNSEVRRRASGRGVVKRGCHCCNGSPAPPRPKKSRQKKTSMDFSNN